MPSPIIPLFPPPYSVRVSRRAHRISLRVLRGTGLEVVLPRWADPALVPELLSRHELWIRKHMAKIPTEDTPASPSSPSHAHMPFPPGLFLRGGAEFYAFCSRYGEDPPLPSFITECARSLLPPHTAERISPKVFNLALPAFHSSDSPAKTYLWLKEWVREEARSRFAFTLDALAEEHGFAYSRLSLKFQKTRWGSCSAKGNINVNAVLLFLPDPLIRYILVHELCHTRALNHSEQFWKEVFAIEPNALKLDAAMRRAWAYVPFWALG